MLPYQPAPFPLARPRRLRASPWVRRLVAETTLTPADLIWPIIVHDGAEARVPVASMPGVFRLSPAEAARAAVEARDLGIPMIALFPNVDGAIKDADKVTEKVKGEWSDFIPTTNKKPANVDTPPAGGGDGAAEPKSLGDALRQKYTKQNTD